MKSFEELLDEPEEALSEVLKNTLSNDSDSDSKKIEETAPAYITKKQRLLYEEYLGNKQKELYKEFRDKKYPEFVKAVRNDMLSKKTNLTNEEYVVCIPSHIKIRRHFEFVGKSVSHLILLLLEAKKNKDIIKLRRVLTILITTLEPHFKDISYTIEKNDKIIILLDNKKYDIITFLEKLSINKVLGFERALEVKMALENV